MMKSWNARGGASMLLSCILPAVVDYGHAHTKVSRAAGALCARARSDCSVPFSTTTAQVLVITDGKVAPPRGLVVLDEPATSAPGPNQLPSGPGLWGEPLAALLMRNGFQGPVHMLVIALEAERDVALPNLRTLCGLTLGMLRLAGSLLYGAEVGQVTIRVACVRRASMCVCVCARARVC
jgi:hypothetical protein